MQAPVTAAPSDALNGFYDQHFAQLMRGQSQHYVTQVKDFVLQTLALAPGQRLLDQGCGIGRISQGLAQAGLQVCGLDCNPGYIAEARQQVPGVEFICADARDYVAVEPVDAVISWHTSFGQHPEHSDNLRVLQNTWSSLRPGGHFLLDFANFYQTLMQFQPVLERSYPVPDGEVQVRRVSELDPLAGLLWQRWHFRSADGQTAERTGVLHVYLPDQLLHMLRQTGFEIRACYGDLTGNPFDLGHSRWICHALRQP